MGGLAGGDNNIDLSFYTRLQQKFPYQSDSFVAKNTTGLRFTLCDVGVSGKSKMAAINRK